MCFLTIVKCMPLLLLLRLFLYNAFNVYCRELALGTVSLTGDRTQGDDSKHCAYSSLRHLMHIIGFLTGVY